MKTIKSYGLNLSLVKLDAPVYGGWYAVIMGKNRRQIKDYLYDTFSFDLLETLVDESTFYQE